METQQEIDYKRIAASIEFLKNNFKNQPGLDEAAEHVHLSPFHFQRMFQQWAGVTPKRFLQYLSVEHAKAMLKNTGATLADTAFETGLSGTGRLHDLFVKVEGMTPGEYKNGGESLAINYSFAESPFGDLIVASTAKGICYMVFSEDDRDVAFNGLLRNYPNAKYTQIVDSIQQNALFIFNQDWSKLSQIKLHLKGTPFQLKVWETLLKVPAGGLTTYSSLAQHAGHAGASRAVGTAIGNNPVAFLIPCHRVIKSTGETGQYHWGAVRKQAIIGWEAVRALEENFNHAKS
ncbi:methylated-DNA--[protein]-cysteine S-methyltransferase [Dyadobacter psychrotolerans]|uniref:methylated-DNA--[protein]-cysteine S-methyltransferase n=1 Tax=Dyadobacter psychrotolerans TaxID=2541721 RepID=A0A4R5DHA1_9BACT|nr:methylated-DNA--[protein]-cysteine S-methyltransferase [Dyadobacter psychrotolerans]TDE11301.1 methylated-DNA--[protein]-cysteine S-methyltransferase [Dyadobacter psychrotolerans]